MFSRKNRSEIAKTSRLRFAESEELLKLEALIVGQINYSFKKVMKLRHLITRAFFLACDNVDNESLSEIKPHLSRSLTFWLRKSYQQPSFVHLTVLITEHLCTLFCWVSTRSNNKWVNHSMPPHPSSKEKKHRNLFRILFRNSFFFARSSQQTNLLRGLTSVVERWEWFV